MNKIELFAKVGADYLEKRIGNPSENEGTSRFLLDSMSGEHVASLCKEILSRQNLLQFCQIKIPENLVEGFDLPEEILTNEKTTYWRNAPCDKPILILANADDEQGQSLKDITPIGNNEIISDVDSWVKNASFETGLTDEQKSWWSKALKGLQQAKSQSIYSFSIYVLATRNAILHEGLPLTFALGSTLPFLEAPKDTSCFETISENLRNRTEKWKRIYVQVFNKRACFLKKLTDKGQFIDQELLDNEWEKLRNEVKAEHITIFEEFIKVPAQKWNENVLALAELEWAGDKVESLFKGIRIKEKKKLGQQTIDFYENLPVDVLTDDELDLLKRLDKRKAKEADELEQEFYEDHRKELADDRRLKAQWDRFVFGAPIESNDFIIGLLKTIGKLFEQAGNAPGEKRLHIQVSKRRDRDWVKDHSEDSIRYFIYRYRGLDVLIGGNVQWDLMRLFQYEDIVKEEKERQKKFKRNTSSSKAANQIKFNLHFSVGHDNYSNQLVWTFDPNSINSEVVNDFERLAKKPFVIGEVGCETVSSKGKIQTIDLSDIGTLVPVYAKTRGSLIPAYKNAKDINKEWLRNLKTSLEDDFISLDEYNNLKSAWQNFTNTYKTAIEQFLSEGVASKAILELEDNYSEIIKQLHSSARGDKNRIKLWRPLIELGTVKVDGTSAMIVPPWHPLRMLSIAIRAKQVSGLISHLLKAEIVDFGDARLFFEDYIQEISSAYYPEVVIGFKGKGDEAELYSVSDTFSDYTLMELPAKKNSTTNENPDEAAKTIKKLVERYLELQPHERANLSLILYNCNSARLPEATVEALSNISTDEEGARCQVILRHQNRAKLADLFKALLEGAANGDDSFVTSESYRDFMSRLRIGIHANEDETLEKNNHHTDIVFLQDIISNHSVQLWEETNGSVAKNIVRHYPPRWSRRKPANRDDLKSIVYLCCPIQPKVGWLYLATLHSIKSGKEPDANKHFLPVLEIDFRNNEVKDLFEKVHQLGQWVVNYDSLLDRRQLRNQGVQVIRFKQSRHGSRNLIISSNAPLNLLDIMIKRRLSKLMADNLLSDNELIEISKKMRIDASEISGDIVLRAAKRGKFVLELIGLVLSKKIIIDEIGTKNPIGWYLLDDYAKWFGQKEGRLADIMALSPSIDEDGNRLLTIIISEVKYIESSSIANESKKSGSQLRETIARIQDAIFETPERLDRDLWLSHIADMLIDRIELSPNSKIKTSEWRDGLKDGTVKIQLRGYSHIFIHTHQPDKEVSSDRVQMQRLKGCWQETFGRKSVQQLVLAYKNNDSSFKERETLDETKPWFDSDFKKPQESIKWENGVASQIINKVREVIKRVNPLNNKQEQQKEVVDNLHSTEKALTISHESNITVPVGNKDLSAFKWAPENMRAILYEFSSKISSEEDDEFWLKETVSNLRSALIGYNMQAKLLDKRLTPNAAIAFFQGSDRLTESQILAKRDNLLTTHALKITNVIPEPGRILISIARPKRQTISLIQLWKNRELTGAPGEANLKLIVGAKESNGETLYLEPSIKDAPHTLIAGTTGSGKSVLLQNLILDIACTNTVKQANIYLIDPKQGADFYILKDIPHLQHGIIGEQNKSAEILKNVVQEMKRRMKVFTGKAPNLIEYNKVVSEEEKLPFIWLIHDEFAAWMIDDNYKDLVSNTVQELGMMARAAGIFLIFAAQRPEARMMTAQLRSNLDNRLILRVASEADSEMALGNKGAERLLGKGHLAARLLDESRIVLGQVPFFGNNNMTELIRYIQ